MALKVITEPKENRQLAMSIEVDEDRFEREMRKAARQVARQMRIPGFRKGRAPYNLVLQYAGRDALLQEFVNDLGEELYKEAIQQEEIEPYASASLDRVDLDPLCYQFTVPLTPEVKLGDYRSLRLEEPDVEIDEEEVQRQINVIRERNAGYQEVTRPSVYGDLMTIDVRGVVLDEEGNETDTVVLDEKDWDVTPDAENPMEPAGFDEALLGLRPGDEKTFEIAWPEESQSMYAGKHVRFTVVVHAIHAYETPELTDELAQAVGDYETAEELIESIRESLREDARQAVEAQYLTKVLEAVIEMSELDYPPAAVERQIDQMVQESDVELHRMGMQGIDHYLELTDQSQDEYRESLREQAETTLRRSLVLTEIAAAEQLRVSDEEFEEWLEEVAGPLGEDADDEAQKDRADLLQSMRTGANRSVLEARILTEKTTERLLAIARGEEIPEPSQDAAASIPEEDEEEVASVAAVAEAAEAEAEPVPEVAEL